MGVFIRLWLEVIEGHLGSKSENLQTANLNSTNLLCRCDLHIHTGLLTCTYSGTIHFWSGIILGVIWVIAKPHHLKSLLQLLTLSFSNASLSIVTAVILFTHNHVHKLLLLNYTTMKIMKHCIFCFKMWWKYPIGQPDGRALKNNQMAEYTLTSKDRLSIIPWILSKMFSLYYIINANTHKEETIP